MEGNMRKAEILMNGRWVEAHPGQIRTNDTFRMYEPDGTLVVDDGYTENVALSDAFICNGVWTVRCSKG
jgi:hypothetical protein